MDGDEGCGDPEAAGSMRRSGDGSEESFRLGFVSVFGVMKRKSVLSFFSFGFGIWNLDGVKENYEEKRQKSGNLEM